MIFFHSQRLPSPYPHVLSAQPTFIMDTLFTLYYNPKASLVNMISNEKTISSVACGIQLFLCLTMMGTEFFLLGLMAYDRYGCLQPSSQNFCVDEPQSVSPRCWCLVRVDPWDGFLLTPITMNVPHCGSRIIYHFFCEIPAVLKLAFADTSLYEALVHLLCAHVAHTHLYYLSPTPSFADCPPHALC